MGRHDGINLIVSLLKWKLASTVMRTQATSVFYFKVRSMVDLESFLEENSAHECWFCRECMHQNIPAAMRCARFYCYGTNPKVLRMAIIHI